MGKRTDRSVGATWIEDALHLRGGGYILRLDWLSIVLVVEVSTLEGAQL